MMIQTKHKITPFIWFDKNAEDAANFYVSLFADSAIIDVARWGQGSPYPEGSTMSVTLNLAGQQYIFFNGGSHFKINESFSLFVNCEDQAEVDHLWNALVADGGSPSQCSWLKDKFGVSWQIVPKALMRLLGDPDSAKAGRVMQAMMTMGKIDVAALERAAAA